MEMGQIIVDDDRPRTYMEGGVGNGKTSANLYIEGFEVDDDNCEVPGSISPTNMILNEADLTALILWALEAREVIRVNSR